MADNLEFGTPPSQNGTGERIGEFGTAPNNNVVDDGKDESESILASRPYLENAKKK
jgi:hypothetical protein